MLSEPPTGTPAEALGSVPSAAIKKEIRKISFYSFSFCEDVTADVVSWSVFLRFMDLDLLIFGCVHKHYISHSAQV